MERVTVSPPPLTDLTGREHHPLKWTMTQNSGPESSPVKGTEQEVRGEFPTVAGSSPYCTVRNTRENESAVCHYINHLRHKQPKAVVTYSLLSTVVSGFLGSLTGLPTAGAPAGTGCPDKPHFHSGLRWDGWRTWGGLVSLPMWSLTSGF